MRALSEKVYVLELGEKIVNSLSVREVFSFPFLGYNIAVSESVIVMWLIMIFLIVFSYILTRKMKTVPEGRQNFIETIVEAINSFTESIIGHRWKLFAPYIGTLLLFLIFSNTVSLFNIIPEWHQLYKLTNFEFFRHLPSLAMRPPTKDINVTFALALMSVLAVIYASIKVKRLSGWLKSYIQPVPIILPMKIMENLIRMLSLSFRLFGNILGAFIIMELLYLSVPLILPAGLSIYFDLFDGILQAFVFVFLTTLYIAEAVE